MIWLKKLNIFGVELGEPPKPFYDYPSRIISVYLVPVGLSLDYAAAQLGLSKIAISGICKNYHLGQFRA